MAPAGITAPWPISPLPPNGANNGEVPSVGVILEERLMKLRFCSLTQPGFIVIVAGFQNIDETPPEPDAAPAKA